MKVSNEQRLVRRLHFSWPVWFAEDFDGLLQHGQMSDVSIDGMAFICAGGQNIAQPGRIITIRFSVPRFGSDDSFHISNFVRSAHVCRAEGVNNNSTRIAVKFTEPLPFDPVEHTEENKAKELLALV